jgi:hypothetical protein
MPFHLDEGLKPFATEAQWRNLTALAQYGSERKAASALGVHKRSFSASKAAVLSKAAASGYAPDCDVNTPVPLGYMLKGTSSYYKIDETTGDRVLRGQWVKTKEDQAKQWELFQKAVSAFADELPPIKPTKGPSSAEADTMVGIPVGDHHLGMLSWGEETGTDYDLSIGERLLHQSIDYLVGAAPACETALLAILGDYLHYDSFESVTPQHKNQLDSDSRYPKMARVGIRCTRRAIESARAKHKNVRVIIAPGNHDPSGAVWLRECLAALYQKEPRVTVDTAPRHFHYFDFGRNLIGVHHGDTVKKMDDLPLIMATDKPEEWGRTAFRYWWTGHIHQDSLRDIQGCKVESFRILPPVDAYAHKSGYRSVSDMKAILYHREFGEVARHTVNPAMFEKAAA